MKVRLRQEYLGYPVDSIVESKNGVFDFRQTVEDVSEQETSKVSLESTISEDYMYVYTDTFEVIEEEKIEVPVAKTKEQIEDKLEAVKADRELLKSLDYKYASKYIHMLDNLVYILEWTLGKAE